MSTMHLSPSSTLTQISTDLKFGASPRNELQQLLQNEQNEALLLLDSNPFLTSLLIKYAKGAPAKAALSENEELVALRNSNNSIREDYNKLHEMYRSAVEEAERARNYSKVQKSEADASYLELEGQHKDTKNQLEKAMEVNEQVSKEVETLQSTLDTTVNELKNAQTEIADMKIEYEASLSKLREEHQEATRKAACEIETGRAEIDKLKVRCDFLWETISDRSEHSRKSAPNSDVHRLKDETEDVSGGLSSNQASRASSPQPIVSATVVAQPQTLKQPTIQTEEVNSRKELSGWGSSVKPVGKKQTTPAVGYRAPARAAPSGWGSWGTTLATDPRPGSVSTNKDIDTNIPKPKGPGYNIKQVPEPRPPMEVAEP